MAEISRMWKSFAWKKVFVKDEKEIVWDIFKIGNIWKQRMMFERKRSGIIKKTCDKSHVRSEVD